MDREELEKIRRLSENATGEIARLQAEISRYKSGADSFEEGMKAIKNLAATSERMTFELGKVIKGIPELDTKKIRAEEKKTRERLNRLAEELEKSNERIERVSEELEGRDREIRREIRKVKSEILEELKEKPRKGFRLFGKK